MDEVFLLLFLQKKKILSVFSSTWWEIIALSRKRANLSIPSHAARHRLLPVGGRRAPLARRAPPP
ncbi:MAG: hypothetical protein QM753_11540 [Thermomicrobiales bacterium]